MVEVASCSHGYHVWAASDDGIVAKALYVSVDPEVGVVQIREVTCHTLSLSRPFLHVGGKGQALKYVQRKNSFARSYTAMYSTAWLEVPGWR